MPGALANLSWAFVLSQVPAGRAAMALYAVPLVSLALAVTWLHETVHLIDMAGASLIVLSLVLVNRKDRAVSRSDDDRQPTALLER
jgi:drug/metabolite transporter (DMT)-like permease